jgi:predicted PurR-regulated permease PerM
VHLVIQTLEGYVLAPLIQRRAVDLSPVLTLAAVMLFGALFGALGVALATPLVAILRVAVVRLYVEDRLGDKQPG